MRRGTYSEWKFKNTTWLSFLRDHIAAEFMDRVQLNRPVVAIDTSGDRVVLTDADGQVLECDRVLVAVPVKILQQERIAFTPALPTEKTDAIDGVYIPPGMKAFLEFEERFYPDMTSIGTAFDKLYIDGVFRKDSAHNLLTLFWVEEAAQAFTDLDDEDLLLAILDELDALFDGQASANLVQWRIQNFSREEWIQGAYSFDYTGNANATVRALAESIDGTLFFAGEHCSLDNTATVPGAMESAYAAVQELLETP